MSFGTGPPEPPPLRRSRWSWWKPVKGTSAVDDYYYNASSSSSNSNGSSNSRPGSRKGRSSLSVLDDKRAEALRKDVSRDMASGRGAPSMTSTTSLAASPSQTGDSSNPTIGSGVGSKNNRKSSSRPPPAWYNRPHHQRYYSASATLQQPGPKFQDDSTLLKLQQRDPTGRPLSVHSSMAMGMLGGPVVSVPPPGQSQIGRPPAAFYPPASHDFAIRIDVPVKEKASATALQAPAMDPMIAIEAFPNRSNRPGVEARSRRSSSSTTASFSTAVSSRESLESRGRASSWGSQTSFESMPSSPQKTNGPGRLSYANYQIQFQTGSQNASRRLTQRPAPIKTFRKKAKPGELFAALPGEVLELILEELKQLHLQPGSSSCATCWMRDCCSIALSARKWLKFARVSLYEDVQLVGGEGALLKKRYKINHGGRMVLLRRTLRNAPHIAAIVRSLKVPSLLPPGISNEEYHDLVASLVMACPNLERLAGFYPNYRHTFSRLFHALSTRQRLKEMNWVVEPSPYQRQHRIRPSTSTNLVAPGDLQPQQSQAFFDHHLHWSHLASLTIHCRPGATLTPNALLTDAIRCLPRLQNLHLSHLPHTSFNDTNLLSLPALKRLTLAHLPGVTTGGLSSFATRRSSTSITTLTLINTNVDSLPALARIFSNLTALHTFSLVQSYPPVMPTDEFIMLFPYLASPSLRKLHWDIPYLPTRASVADTILARSLSAGGFPALRVLRAPNDPEGVFQAVCRPRERVDHPADRYRPPAEAAGPRARSGSASSGGTFSFAGRGVGGGGDGSHGRTGSRGSSFGGGAGAGLGAPGRSPPASPGFAPPADAAMFLPRENSDLRAARLAAQGRLEAARRFPRFFVNVIDVDGTVAERYGICGFVGTVESKINYFLLPDAGATDEGGGLVGVGEMLGDNGEQIGVIGGPDMALGGGRRGSIGVLGKKDRTRERSRSRDRGGNADAPVQVREGCTGRWNANDAALSDKKDRERWQHAERGRWRRVVLS